ncbi:hypothetical protein AURDEDRAFT_160986 [Auricularia subglabra TFB-10046 SS5]|nr:hypothetical protein AURDEDRAFT_160986 [Auricularia subglabra TFB-10046 SS5]
MSYKDHTLSLPPELLFQVLDSLSVPELLRASHVNTRWRLAACEHLTYWRDVVLFAASPLDLQFYHARLIRGRSRSLRLRISVPAELNASLAADDIFAPLSRHALRLEELHVDAPGALSTVLYQHLANPAPRLEHLSISARGERVISAPPLPDTLFAGNSPLLRRIDLEGVSLPPRPPLALRAVTRLSLVISADFDTRLDWFYGLPHLQDLRIHARSWTLGAEAAGPASDAGLRSLQRLEVLVESHSYSAMLSLPCAHVPHIVWAVRGILAAPALISHLRGPLRLSVRGRGDDALNIDVASLVTGWTRRFTARHGAALKQQRWLHEAYLSSDVAQRLQHLSIPDDLCALLDHTRSLPALRELEVHVLPGDVPEGVPASLCVPQLQRVTFCGWGASSLVQKRMLVPILTRLDGGGAWHELEIAFRDVDAVVSESRVTFVGVRRAVYYSWVKVNPLRFRN